jgi:hypothetical protein
MPTVISIDEQSIQDIPEVRIVRRKDFVGVVAEREWDAVRAARRLKVTWQPFAPQLPGNEGCSIVTARRSRPQLALGAKPVVVNPAAGGGGLFHLRLSQSDMYDIPNWRLLDLAWAGRQARQLSLNIPEQSADGRARSSRPKIPIVSSPASV